MHRSRFVGFLFVGLIAMGLGSAPARASSVGADWVRSFDALGTSRGGVWGESASAVTIAERDLRPAAVQEQPSQRLVNGGEEPNSIPWFPARIRGDVGALVHLPLEMNRREWRNFAIAAAAVGAVGAFDRQIRDSVQGESASSRDFARSVRPLGQEGGIGLLALAWLGGRATHSETLVATADDGFEALLLTDVLIVPTLKEAFGRGRPRNVGNDADAFGQGSASFPSGEAAEAFTIASVIAAHSSRWWVDSMAYGAAGLVGWARLRVDAHWASDVVAGAIIGTAVGHWVVRRNEESRWTIVPEVGRGTGGAVVHLSF